MLNNKKILRDKGYEYFDEKKTLSALEDYLRTEYQKILNPQQGSGHAAQRDTVIIVNPPRSYHSGNSSFWCCCFGGGSGSSSRDDSDDASALSILVLALITCVVYVGLGYSLYKVKNAKLENNKISVPVAIGLGTISAGTAVVFTLMLLGNIAPHLQQHLKLNNKDFLILQIFIGFNVLVFGLAAGAFFGISAYQVSKKHEINNMVDEVIAELTPKNQSRSQLTETSPQPTGFHPSAPPPPYYPSQARWNGDNSNLPYASSQPSAPHQGNPPSYFSNPSAKFASPYINQHGETQQNTTKY